MNKKLLFFDIDGTLMDTPKRPNKRIIASLKKAQENGHLIFINTGRSERDIPEDFEDINFDGFVLSGGNVVLVGDEKIKNTHMDPELVKEVMDLLTKENVDFTLEAENNDYSTQDKNAFDEMLFSEEASSELKRSFHTVKKALDSFNDEPVFKISFSLDKNRKEEFSQKLEKLKDKVYVVWHGNLFQELPIVLAEIIQKGTSKGEGIKEVCKYLNLPIEDTIAFGDSFNDKEMLETAGIGVAMGNSLEDFRLLADKVCEPCSEDGIYCELKREGII